MAKRNSRNTRGRIISAAWKLFYEQGYDGTTVEDIVFESGTSKGSFYHYFRSKEAFGVALLEHHYTGYLQRLVDHFDHGDGNYRDRLLAYYQHTLNQFCQQGIISGCLTVKLSAEVCDLSEDMRAAMDRGASQIIALLGDALEKGRQEGSLAFDGEAMTLSQVLYSLWLGANLQAKITRSATPLESALAHAKQIIAAPAV